MTSGINSLRTPVCIDLKEEKKKQGGREARREGGKEEGEREEGEERVGKGEKFRLAVVHRNSSSLRLSPQ